MTSEDFRDRLRRLRRETPAPNAPAAAEQRAISVRGALARRAQRWVRLDASVEREHVGGEGELDDGERRLDGPPTSAGALRGMPTGLERTERGDGILLARREIVAREHRHGSLPLESVAAADPRAFAVLTRDPALAEIDLRRAIYLDTETSGLSGGAGTYVFMVGLGVFADDGFHVWQGFLDDPAHEKSLLDETAARLRAAPAIVSFFGKSFDRHRLEDRMRCLGIEPPFAGKAHLDLYHPLRALYRRAFADHRLRTLESALCGLARDDDLPGSFAPAAWFDHLAGRPHRLEGVFRHNRDDVLSLVTLAAHLGSVLRAGDVANGGSVDAGAARGGTVELEVLRAANLARALARAGDRARALDVCAAALSRADVGERRARELRVLQAELWRARGDRTAALQALRELASESEDEHTCSVLLALARLEWRELGDVGGAQLTCARAASVARNRHVGPELARLERAIASLQQMLARRAASSK